MLAFPSCSVLSSCTDCLLSIHSLVLLIARWLLPPQTSYPYHTPIIPPVSGEKKSYHAPSLLLANKWHFRSQGLKLGHIHIFGGKGYWEIQHRIILIDLTHDSVPRTVLPTQNCLKKQEAINSGWIGNFSANVLFACGLASLWVFGERQWGMHTPLCTCVNMHIVNVWRCVCTVYVWGRWT